MEFGVIIILAVLLTPTIIYFVKYNTSKMNTDKCGRLDKNATIINVRSEKNSWGRNTHIKTIVEFSDGSEYYTYKSRREPGFGYSRLVVDKEVIEDIKVMAIKAHSKLVGEFSNQIEEKEVCVKQKIDTNIDEILLHNVLEKYSSYSEEFLRVFIYWSLNFSSNKYNVLQYLEILNQCIAQRTQESGLQICYKIHLNKMNFEEENIIHMFRQLDAVIE